MLGFHMILAVHHMRQRFLMLPSFFLDFEDACHLLVKLTSSVMQAAKGVHISFIDLVVVAQYVTSKAVVEVSSEHVILICDLPCEPMHQHYRTVIPPIL